MYYSFGVSCDIILYKSVILWFVSNYVYLVALKFKSSLIMYNMHDVCV